MQTSVRSPLYLKAKEVNKVTVQSHVDNKLAQLCRYFAKKKFECVTSTVRHIKVLLHSNFV